MVIKLDKIMHLTTEQQLKEIREILQTFPWPLKAIHPSESHPLLKFKWSGVAGNQEPTEVALREEGAVFFHRNRVLSEHLEAPPLGITPRNIHNAHRANDLSAAICRYISASKKVPAEWYEELQQLTDTFND